MSNDIITEATSAAISGIVSSTCLFPLERIKTKLQATAKPSPSFSNKLDESSSSSSPEEPPEEEEGSNNNESSKANQVTAFDVAQEIYDDEGALGFMRGFHFSAAQSAIEKGLYFIAYTGLKNTYTSLTNTTTAIPTIPNLALGCIAEWCHLPFSLPLDVLTTRLATDKTNASAFFILSTLIKEKGMGGMYKGYQAFAVLCLKPSIQYTVYERIKAMVIVGKVGAKELSAAEAFLIGMVARTIATVATFPYVRAKVMMQAGGETACKKAGSIPEMLKAIYADEGLAGLFQGIGPELTRGVLSAAMMLMVKEKIYGSVYKALHSRGGKAYN